MTRTEYHVSEGQIFKVHKYLRNLVSEGSATKILNEQGLALYQVPIGEDEILSSKENIVIALNFISKNIITSGSTRSSRSAERELEEILGEKLTVKTKSD